MHNKYNPHKSCSCGACRFGRRTRYGKLKLKVAERKDRRLTKLALQADPHNFEPVLVATDYTD